MDWPPVNPDRGRRAAPKLCSMEPADFRQCLPIRLSSSGTLKTRDKGEFVRLPERSEDHLRLVIDTIPGFVWSARPDGTTILSKSGYTQQKAKANKAL